MLLTITDTRETRWSKCSNKLRKTVKVGATVQYIQDYLPGRIEYRQTGTGVKRVESVFHAEGRYYNTNVDVSSTISWRKEYNFKDHLGNTRLVFTDRNANGVVDITGTASTSDVLQENHYYAFGLAFEGAWLQNDATARDNAYQYNGKELNSDFGLGWNDYGARWYDPGIGRWNAVDIKVGKYKDLSPYNYVSNNPLVFIDPNGMEIVLGNIYEKDKNGKYRRPEIVKAFELFAQSKLGIGILSEFAKKGQVIAGHKYDKDGKFHVAKIDLKIGSDNLNGSPNSGWSDYGPNGVTTYYSGSGKNTILVTLNNGLNSYNNDRSSNFKNNPTNKMSRDMYIFDRAITVVHEILVHGIDDAEDYRDDGKVNSDKSAKEDHLEARKPNSSFSKQGFNVVKEMAKNFGIDMTNEKIKEMMFDFHN